MVGEVIGFDFRGGKVMKPLERLLALCIIIGSMILSLVMLFGSFIYLFQLMGY